MHYDKFIRQVAAKAGLDKPKAEVAVAAFLMTLGEIIPRDERDDLAAELPKEFEAAFAKERRYRLFDLEEFYNRVSARADVGYPDAVKRAKAVAAVLKQAVSDGEIEDVMDHLPGGYREMFGKKARKTAGPLSMSI